MQPAGRLLILSTLLAAGVAGVSHGEILLSWDEASPVFFQPLLPGETVEGTLSGTVEVTGGDQITHYTFYNAFCEAGQSLEAQFSPEFSQFLLAGATGSFNGPIVEFTVTQSTLPGVYDQNPYDVQQPFPYLQFHDLGTETSSAPADFELIVVDQFPPVVDLNNDGFVDGADLGLLLGDWGCVGAACVGDLNGDFLVDGADLGLLLGDWSP